MTNTHLKSTELEKNLSNRIRNLYGWELDRQLDEISYQWFDNQLVIIIEGTVTQPEQLLNNNSNQELAKKVRAVFDEIIQPQIKVLIEEVLDVTVVDFLSSTTLDTGRTGAIAIFELQPNKSPVVTPMSGLQNTTAYRDNTES